MMMMIGQLNASHTGVSGGPSRSSATQQTRIRLRPRRRRVGLLQGRPRLQGRPGRSRLPEDQGRHYRRRVDGHDLKSGDNYWQLLHARAGNKFHFLINDKPSKDGAWEVTITPVAPARSATCSTRSGSTIAARW
jgi:hypothetical protein